MFYVCFSLNMLKRVELPVFPSEKPESNENRLTSILHFSGDNFFGPVRLDCLVLLNKIDLYVFVRWMSRVFIIHLFL